jgi:hypothetical protein
MSNAAIVRTFLNGQSNVLLFNEQRPAKVTVIKCLMPPVKLNGP